MDVQIDLRVAELLASRLCHDLVGPIGAVNNGLELLEDEDVGMSDDALELTAGSARQAANALQFYRLAYGMAGSRLGADPSELRELVAGHLASGKATLDWAVERAPEGAPDGLPKLLLNLIALAEECLPRGGGLAASLAEIPGGVEVAVTAAGEGAGLRADAAAGLADSVVVDELTPRSVQGYFTRLLAKRVGADLGIDTPGPDTLKFSVTIAS